MHYIKDIFENKKTKHTHNKFIRYSRGDFVGPLVNIKVQKAGVRVNASFHFIDELLILAAEVLGDKIVNIKGSLVWNKDLSSDLESLGIKYLKVSKSRGIFKYTLDNEVNLKKFIDKFNNYYLLITVKHDKFSLVTKSALPKPNKEFGPDFCKVLFPISFKDKILSEFAFDVDDKSIIKELKIRHQIKVEDIILPEGKLSFEEARRLAVRKGDIEREIFLNGSETPISSKVDFNI